jgi:hypothetical protein
MVISLRASDRGCIGVFYAFKTPKTHWRFCNSFYFFGLKLPPWYVLSNLLCKNMTPNALKCILLPWKYLKFVKIFLRQSPKSMKGSQIHLALAHWKWHTPRVEQLSNAPNSLWWSGKIVWSFWWWRSSCESSMNTKSKHLGGLDL